MNLLHRHRLLRAGDVQLYTACENVTEIVVYLMLVFSPWAFGTTQHWSIWTMNTAGYLLGALLAVKVVIRRWKGYQPPRWGAEPHPLSANSGDPLLLSGERCQCGGDTRSRRADFRLSFPSEMAAAQF